MTSTRREFLEAGAVIAIGGVAAACSSSSGGADASVALDSRANDDASSASDAISANDANPTDIGHADAGQADQGFQDAAPTDQGFADAQPTQGCSAQAPAITIRTNHGHVLVIPQSDVARGTETTYTMTGGTHSHDVTITAANFAELRARNPLLVVSTSVNAHTHGVDVSCA